MRKKKKGLYDGKPHDFSDNDLYALGKTKDGKPATKTISRERLSDNTILALNEFIENSASSLETSKTMRDIYNKLHKVNHDFGTNQCSTALQELQNKGFLHMLRGSLTKKADRTDTVNTARKARFWLTEKAASKTLTVDSKGWVKEDGKHIASDEIRAYYEARKAKENKDDTA